MSQPRISRWLFGQYKEFVAAVRFLSTVPIPGSNQLFQTDNADPCVILGSAFFPLVGLLLASLLSLLSFLLHTLLLPLALAALLVVALIFLTGGLHLDGLMDSCDGLFGGTNRERKLEIMRDSRVGSFGVLGGASVLLLKFAFFASLPLSVLPVAFLTVLPVSRWAMILAVGIFPSARPNGLGATFRQTVTSSRLLFAGFTSLSLALIFAHLPGLLIWGTGSCIALLVGWWITYNLGGLTGDSYGALAEISEVVLLLVFVGLRSWL